MNIYIALLKREFILFTKNIIPNLLLYSVFPIFLFLFLMVPLNKIIDTNTGMSYLYHGMPSIIFVSSTMIAFIVPLLIIKRDRYDSENLKFIFTISTNNIIYSLYILTFAILTSYIQFSVSLFFSMRLAESIILGLDRALFFFVAIFPSMLLFATFGLLLSNFIKKNESIIICIFFLFIILAFGIGSFIPIDYFSEKYYKLTYAWNLIFHLYNIFIKIFEGENIGFGVPIIAILISIFFYFINTIFFLKTLRKY